MAESIRRRIPNAAITTDLIVGFPGETDDDFEATLAYVARGVFANAFTFHLFDSPRNAGGALGAGAARDVARARFARLIDAQNAATRAYHERKVGTRRAGR